MKALGYLRVSTDEQRESGAGLEVQRHAINSEADRRGWDLTMIEDAGYSAKSLKRPGIIEALELLRTGEADVLVVSKLDRLSRSMLDFAAVMERSRLQGWSLVALDLGVDTSTPAGEAMANVMATFAQFERRLIGQRTKDALAVKRAQGVRLGRPPTISSEVRSRIVQLRAQGLTLKQIAAQLTADGVPTAFGGAVWWHSTVSDVLRSEGRAA